VLLLPPPSNHSKRSLPAQNTAVQTKDLVTLWYLFLEISNFPQLVKELPVLEVCYCIGTAILGARHETVGSSPLHNVLDIQYILCHAMCLDGLCVPGGRIASVSRVQLSHNHP
jgi:hypothetical protein